MSAQAPTFQTGVIRPVEALKAGYDAIRDQYWLMVGIAFVGVLIGGMVPLGILLGPMMVGIHMCMLRKIHGQQVSFDMLFKGFDYFVPALLVALIHIIPAIILIIPIYIGFVASIVGLAAAADASGGNIPPEVGLVVPIIFGIVIFFAALILIVINILFSFAYQLIFDRGLGAGDACKLSAKAAMANFGGLLGLALLSGLMSLGGLLLCYVGMVLVLPITLAATNVAYRAVFPAQVVPPQAPYGMPPQHPWQGPPPGQWS